MAKIHNKVDENTREIKRTNTRVDPKPRILIAKLNKKVDHREELESVIYDEM